MSDNQHLIAAGAMTGTAVLTGKALCIRNCSRISMIAVWTGTPTGAFSFEVNNSPKPFLDDGTADPRAPAWTTLTLPSGFAAGNPAGGVGNFDFQFLDMGEIWIRPKYTNATSSGTLDVWGSAKP